ncbi:MAG TPA: tryptophan synthase subunit alpha [Candidatus Fimousia stercorigallinarum]|nr:tryptophan synthase subunit alpha [Candidatus Fimousia stercorigallinarum]
MSRISRAFKNGKAFIAFLTGGDPTIEKSEQYILKMVEAGADLIEIGVPFSDPIAEGPVIQNANVRALANGATTDQLFELVERVRKKTEVPMVFLLYANLVFKYGYERFCKRCQEAGVDGLIIPDLPFEEKGELAPIARAHGVDVISLIAPTSEERIKMIASDASGFLYIVSSMGVTGIRQEITTDLSSIIKAVKEATDIPAAIGFGISTPEQAKKMAGIADGAIVGSAIVKIIEQYGEHADEAVYQYVKSMKEAVREIS